MAGTITPDGTLLEGWKKDDSGLLLPDGSRLALDKAARFQQFGDFEDVEQTRAEPRPLPPSIIDGILSEKEFFLVSSDSKGRKTMLTMQMALSIASGKPFLPNPKWKHSGFQVTRGKVLYLNFELHPGAWNSRLAKQCKGLGIGPGELKGWLYPWQLRGKGMLVEDLIQAIKYQMARQSIKHFDVIFLDPLYVLFRGKKENDAGEMAEALYEIQALTEESGLAASVAGTHHFPKGSGQEDKNQIDRASGSGVFARITDDICTLTVTKANRKDQNPPAKFEETRRNFKAPVPFTMRFDEEALLWLRDDETVTPEGKVQPGGRGDFVDFFRERGQKFQRKELVEQGIGRKWGKDSTVEVLLTTGIKDEILEAAGKRGQYKLGINGEQEWDRRHGVRYLEIGNRDLDEKDGE